MKLILLCAVLISVQGFAQESDYDEVNAKVSFNSSPVGGGEMALGVERPNFVMSGGWGFNKKNDVGYFDVELKNELNLSKNRKFRMVVGYTPYEHHGTMLSKTTDILLKAKLGLAYDKTILKYTISPATTFDERGKSDSYRALAQGAEVEQKIGDHIKILGMVRTSNIKQPKGKAIIGQTFKGHAEANYRFKNGISVFAFYEIENYDYEAIVDKSVLNSPRIQSKNSVSYAGIGIKGDFRTKNKSQ